MYSAICGGIGALRGPKHGGANEAAFEIQKRYATRRRSGGRHPPAHGAKEVIIGFGHPVYTIADPRNQVIKGVAKHMSEDAGSMRMFDIAERIEQVMARDQEDVRRTSTGTAPSRYHMLGVPTGDVHAAVCHRRTAGWSAHMIEQRIDNKIIRPTANYTGPETATFVPLSKR